MAYTTIDKPSDYFNTKLYTGNGSSRSITGVGFQPDWLWIKDRSDAQNHGLRDVIRGATKRLVSNSTNAENTQSQGVSSFDSDGFSLGTGTDVNANSDTYVSWNWKAGTSFTNDASATGIGTIDSTGSASDTSGFSIVSYTGTGSNGTVKHGLSTAPKMIFFKGRTNTIDWNIGSDMLGWSNFINLNTTSAQQTHNLFQNTAPTSSIFYLSGDAGVNGSSVTYIAYCFAEKKGYSKFGSYTGNGNADGTFVYTGFKPAWFMLKQTNATDNWHIFDNKRDPFNMMEENLRADLANAEFDSGVDIDFVSNGVKLRNTDDNGNGSGDTYIYMAFAENPFVTSTGVPACAR